MDWNVWTFAAFTCSSNWQALRFRFNFVRVRARFPPSPPHRKRPLGNANANRVISPRTRNGPLCARGLRHKRIWRLQCIYARVARIPHNEERWGRSRPRVSQKDPRHVCPLFGHPCRRAESNPDFSHARSRFPIERFVLVHCYAWPPFWKI